MGLMPSAFHAKNAALKIWRPPEEVDLGQTSNTMTSPAQVDGLQLRLAKASGKLFPDYYLLDPVHFPAFLKNGLAYRKHARSTGARAARPSRERNKSRRRALLAPAEI